MVKDSLSHAQQFFLQVMISKKVIDQNTFKDVFYAVSEKFDLNVDDANFKEFYPNFLREINNAIRAFNMEIKTATCETSTLTFFCLIRQTDTGQIGTLSTLYSSVELKVYRKILEMVVESEQGYVDFGQIANEVSDMFEGFAHDAATQSAQTTKIPSTSEIRQIVEKFIQDCWLVEVVDKPHMITLHGRALVELSEYIKQLFKDGDVLNHCYICKALVLSAYSCEHCSCKIHRYCAKNMFKKSRDCPNCRAAFTKDQEEEFLVMVKQAKDAYNKKIKAN
jgi:hypothetical protein